MSKLFFFLQVPTTLTVITVRRDTETIDILFLESEIHVFISYTFLYKYLPMAVHETSTKCDKC